PPERDVQRPALAVGLACEGASGPEGVVAAEAPAIAGSGPAVPRTTRAARVVRRRSQRQGAGASLEGRPGLPAGPSPGRTGPLRPYRSRQSALVRRPCPPGTGAPVSRR